jgi:hypothetical protein
MKSERINKHEKCFLPEVVSNTLAYFLNQSRPGTKNLIQFVVIHLPSNLVQASKTLGPDQANRVGMAFGECRVLRAKMSKPDLREPSNS